MTKPDTDIKPGTRTIIGCWPAFCSVRDSMEVTVVTGPPVITSVPPAGGAKEDLTVEVTVTTLLGKPPLTVFINQIQWSADRG